MENQPTNPIVDETTKPQGVFGGPIGAQDELWLKEFLSRNSASVVARSRRSSNQSITNTLASATKITLNTNDFVQGITWDSTNSRFTCTTAGYYLVIGAVYYTNPGTDFPCAAYLYKNGAVFASTEIQSSAIGGDAETGMHVSDIVSLAVGDYVELYTAQNSAGALNINSAADLTYLSIPKV